MSKSNEYDFQKIESKWQKYWEENQTFKIEEDLNIPKEKRLYLLDMFPYPSGDGLHVGHVLGYSATDIWGRFKTMQGYHVLHPMGFDSFGLPAENYAIETGIHPEITTQKNISRFRSQIKSLGLAYDWSREIQTSDPSYYKWTQWIFLKLLENNLAYEAEIPVWYCPQLGTVLANEEILQLPEGPRSERGKHPVERRSLRQWMLKITAYAERLLEDLEDLDWPESIKSMQRHWIGKSEGANIYFDIPSLNNKFIEVYTTRPDTIYGVTYLVIAPEHPLVEKLTTKEQENNVHKYRKIASLKSDLERSELSKEKTGVFTGSYAKNPLNDDLIPIWIGDYVLGSYGTGAVMGVPAHDERDFTFSQTYNLPKKFVVKPKTTENSENIEQAFVEEGISYNSQSFSGLETCKMKEAVIKALEKKGKGKRKVNYRLRDWIFSRQRYWGEPIPILKRKDGSFITLTEEDLPLTLPSISEYKPSGTGESPLAKIKEWTEFCDPQTGEIFQRETNTMPQWAGSCWYYLRYLDPHNNQALASPEKIDYWLPVDLYVGGAEHAVLHLLYARFWHKVLFDIGVVKIKEPFQKLVNQGMITAYAYQRPDGSLVPNDQVIEISEKEWKEHTTNIPLNKIVAKMSKSLKNVVTPEEIIDQFGADSLRIYEMFMGPLTDSKPWNTQGLVGVHRFLKKFWNLQFKVDQLKNPCDTALKKIHKAIKKVSINTDKLNFNVAISALMILVNELQEEEFLTLSIWKSAILLLAPYAPHMAEELWQMAGHNSSLYKERFPIFDENYIKEEFLTIAIQINGKLKSKMTVASNDSQEKIQEKALQDPKIASLLKEKNILKIIIVPNKIVNIVIK